MDLLRLNRAYSARAVKKRRFNTNKLGNRYTTVAALELVKTSMVFAKAKVWHQCLPKLLEELQFHDYWQNVYVYEKERLTVAL